MKWRALAENGKYRLRSAYPLLLAHPVWAGVSAFLLLIFLVLVTSGFWLKPVAESRISAALGRPVTISGLDVDLIPPLRITAHGIEVANPEEFADKSRFGSIRTVRLGLSLPSLLIGRLYLSEVLIDQPQGDLRAGPSGRENWIFGEQDDGDAAGSFTLPEIGRLVINDGHVRLADPKRKLDATVDIHTETLNSGEERVILDAKGRYLGQPLTVHFNGGSVIALDERSKPYPLNLEASHGGSRIKLSGNIEDPFHLAGARLKLVLQGKDMSELYPLIGVPLAPTPPYRLSGRLDYRDGRFAFTDFDGIVGESDLRGTFEVDPGTDRPLIIADLTSKRVVLADLGGFIGTTPGDAGTPNQSAEQKKEHRREEANPKFLPDKPLNIPEIRAADFRVKYKGLRIEGESMPLDNLEADLVIENGKITLKPLKFGIGSGEIRSTIVLDARRTPVRMSADIDFRRVDLKRLMESTGIFEGGGRIGGRARIETTGKSLAEMLAKGDGELQLFMVGGNVSSLLVNLAGLDFGNSLLSLLQLPPRTNIRCMVSDFGMEKGLLQTRSLIFDTDATNLVGTGTINLANERLDYKLTAEPKTFSVGSIQAPILIKGTLKDPSIGPDAGAVAARAGPAVALGALLTPLAALIPTIQLGLGEDNDCVKLIRSHQPRKP